MKKTIVILVLLFGVIVCLVAIPTMLNSRNASTVDSVAIGGPQNEQHASGSGRDVKIPIDNPGPSLQKSENPQLADRKNGGTRMTRMKENPDEAMAIVRELRKVHDLNASRAFAIYEGAADAWLTSENPEAGLIQILDIAAYHKDGREADKKDLYFYYAGDFVSQLGAYYVSKWHKRDPDGAWEAVTAVPTGPLQDHALETLIDREAMGNTPAKSLERLRGLPAELRKDKLVVHTYLVLHQHNPDTYKDHIDTVENERIRRYVKQVITVKTEGGDLRKIPHY